MLIFISPIRKTIKKNTENHTELLLITSLQENTLVSHPGCPLRVLLQFTVLVPHPMKVTITLTSVLVTLLYFFSILLPKCVSLHTIFYRTPLKLL